jgi:hypothetical protein
MGNAAHLSQELSAVGACRRANEVFLCHGAMARCHECHLSIQTPEVQRLSVAVVAFPASFVSCNKKSDFSEFRSEQLLFSNIISSVRYADLVQGIVSGSKSIVEVEEIEKTRENEQYFWIGQFKIQ